MLLYILLLFFPFSFFFSLIACGSYLLWCLHFCFKFLKTFHWYTEICSETRAFMYACLVISMYSSIHRCGHELMCAHVHAHMHTQTQTETHKHTHMHTLMHGCAHTYTPRMHIHVQTCMNMLADTYIHVHAHTHTHTHLLAYSLTHSDVQTHVPALNLLFCYSLSFDTYLSMCFSGPPGVPPSPAL